MAKYFSMGAFVMYVMCRVKTVKVLKLMPSCSVVVNCQKGLSMLNVMHKILKYCYSSCLVGDKVFSPCTNEFLV